MKYIMLFNTSSCHGSVTASTVAGSCWPDSDDFLSCPSDEKLGVTSKRLWACWTASCLDSLFKAPEFVRSVCCLRFMFVEIAFIFLLVLSMGFGWRIFGILKLKHTSGRICCWADDDLVALCDTDVTFPGIEIALFSTFELLTEVVCLVEVKDCFVGNVDGVFACVQWLDLALRLISGCLWRRSLTSSILCCRA